MFSDTSLADRTPGECPRCRSSRIETRNTARKTGGAIGAVAGAAGTATAAMSGAEIGATAGMIGGPVGSGKTTLLEMLCKAMRDTYDLVAITNDIYTKEDQRLLTVAGALPAERIMGVETGGCPHTAIREDASVNLEAMRELSGRFPNLDLILLESGGDNLSAQFSRELADYTIYVIDVSGGDKIPRKGGPGITQSDLLVINKTDLAALVGADLDVMERDARRMRGDGPFIFTQVTKGVGIDEIASRILAARERAL